MTSSKNIALNTIADFASARKNRRRLGRGIGSGRGKTCGRGYKGQKSRTGVSLAGFEGGQMPLHRRLPKRGFVPYRRAYRGEVSLERLGVALESGALTSDSVIDVDLLKAKGLVRPRATVVRVMGAGEFSHKIRLKVSGVSSAARDRIVSAGGEVL
jgi:large subunit ribosomal protein L15